MKSTRLARLLTGTTFLPWCSGIIAIMVGVGLLHVGWGETLVGIAGAALIALLCCRPWRDLQTTRDYISGVLEGEK